MNGLPYESNSTHTVEGIARVVRVEGERAWLEPEQTASCGSCAAGAACGTRQAPGIGTVTSRIEARQFALDNPPGAMELRVGERVVVGVQDRALVKGSLLAYALPLLSSLGLGAWADSTWGSDAWTMAATFFGLGAGLVAARLGALRLSARGQLTPRVLRRARPGETCGTA